MSLQSQCACTREVEITSLVPNPRNPNKHSPEQIKMLAKAIEFQGWRHPIVVSQRSGFIVTGHGRLEAAKLLKLDKVPVDFQEFESEAQEWAHLIADNRIAELAEMDGPLLKDLLEGLDTGDLDMELTGYDEQALEQLMTQFHTGEDQDAEPQIDKAEELNKVWQVKTGDLWLVGEHRLVCGDSTKKEDVGRVLGGEKPNLMVTDPPYGVEYDANWRNEADRANGKPYGARAIGKVTNDDKSSWIDAFLLSPSDTTYVWHASASAIQFAVDLMSAGYEIRNQIIWVKNNFAISRGHYHWKHEPCWYAVRKGCNASWIGDRSQTTAWDIDKPMKSETGHSTQKPLECMARPIRNHSGDVYDPFLGSGTTMVAAQNLSRKCYGIEISPAYCAVILERMKTAFPNLEIRKA